jgi:transposase
MEACAGAHCLARKLQTFGHRVLLIAPQFVRPFVKGNKTDFADAEAICEAASRPSMRFVAVKTPGQQTLLALHRVRESLVAERTATANQIHGFLLEFGVSLPVGARAIKRLPALLDDANHALPPRLVCILLRLHRRHGQLCEEIAQIEGELKLQLAEDEAGQRLLTIPGIGPMTASSLLVQGARAVMQRAERRTDVLGIWLKALMQRRHSNVVACALANKMARIVWAILARGGEYRAHPAVA